MSKEASFERAILMSPDDDTTYRAYTDWLDERGDRRGAMLRAWFQLRAAAVLFELGLEGEVTEDDREAFWEAAYRYERLAAEVSRDWLWRLGAARPWVGRDLGMLIMRHDASQRGYDWRAVAEAQTADLGRAWMFRYDGPDGPWREAGQDYPALYLIHKLSGSVAFIGSLGPESTFRRMEERLWGCK